MLNEAVWSGLAFRSGPWPLPPCNCESNRTVFVFNPRYESGRTHPITPKCARSST
jgi:hypothetical protein